MFDKNQSTIKSFLMEKVREQTSFSSDIIEKVISFQGEDILNAVKESNQIEISGFGLLFISKSKLRKRISRYSDKLEKVRGINPEYDKTMEDLIEFLKKKQCQNSQNM